MRERSGGRETGGSGARSPSRCCPRSSRPTGSASGASSSEARAASALEPSQHRHDPRGRRGATGRAYHRHGAGRRADAARDAPGRTAADAHGCFRSPRRSADGLARAHAARDRSPGLEAREPDGDEGRLRQDPRLRPGQARRSPERPRPGSRRRRRPRTAPERARFSGRSATCRRSRRAGSRSTYRSDQFSLGAILYEMATGRRAFQQRHAGRDALGDHPRGSRAGRNPEPAGSRAPALDDRALPRQEPGGPLRLDARPGARPREPAGPSLRGLDRG